MKNSVSCFFSKVLVWFVISIVSYAALVGYDAMKFSYATSAWWPKFYGPASDFLIGGIISFFFYFLVVHIPDSRKRNMLKGNFSKIYKQIKQNILYQIIFASQKGGIDDLRADSETIDRLMTVDGFQTVFKEGKEGHEGWYAFANGLEVDGNEFKEILSNLRMMAKQIDFILHNYTISDEKIFGSLKQLEMIIFQMERLQPQSQYDDTKILCRFLWEIFSGWSGDKGYVGYDPIEKMINDIK